MTAQSQPAVVQIDLEIRVTYPCTSGELTRILRVLRSSGGRLHSHLIYRLYERSAAFFLCEHPSRAALALQNEGFEAETETVVTIRTRNRPGLLSHLIQTLEAEQLDVGYSYATMAGHETLIVLRTGDNPKAEDVLRAYLMLDLGNAGWNLEANSG